MNLNPGALLQGGKYRIVRFIKSGGFGCTYEAVHVLSCCTVAIKEFFVRDFCNRDSVTGNVHVLSVGKQELVDKLCGKFIDEAQMMMKMRYPGIVRVTDVFKENGTAYYVMDYIDGKSLGEIVAENGPLGEEVAVEYIKSVAAALKYVHGRNCLHLDVKPANILLANDGTLHLIDFGVSKQYDEVANENTSTLMGSTPGYAPPEQTGNSLRKFTPAADIYALGATLYKLLTGITPVNASLRSSGEELDPLPQTISASVRHAVEASMQMNKNKRPQSVEEFLGLVESGEMKDAICIFGNASSDGSSAASQDVMPLGSQKASVAKDESGEMKDERAKSKDETNLSMGAGQNAANGNAAVEENEIEVEVVEVPSAAQKPPSEPKQPKEKKSSKGLWIVILLLLVIGGAAGGFMFFGGGSDAKKDSAKDTVKQIAQQIHAPIKETNDTPTIQTDKKDTITPLQKTVSEEPAAEHTTQLKINGAPNGAYVYVDGNYFDETPLKDATISIGRHTIKVVKEGYESYEKKHTFTSQPAAIDVNLKKTPATLSLATTPGGADVYVDGNYIGTSSISGHKIEQGTHKITVKKTGYETIEKTYTFTSQTALINLTLTAKPKPQPQNKNIINGHEYVDLGLSVKWATCNVGASKPEEYGNHYAWGETSTKSSCTENNSVTYGKNFSDIGGNPTYDVARKEWGSTWRLPTKAEFDELRSNCTWTWTMQNGINGYKVTSKKNGNSIFLPAAGWRKGTSLYRQGTNGYYWSSTPHESNSYSCYLSFYSGSHVTGWYYRYGGPSVRPVSK